MPTNFPFIGLIILLIIIAIIAVAIFIIKNFLVNTARSIFGTDTIKEGLENQADLLSETPKSVSGMTSIYLPQIQKDFPEFNWNEFSAKAENMLKSAFKAISASEISLLQNASEDLKTQVSHIILNNTQNQATANYDNVIIHQTEISRYLKQAGTCVITIQSAVEYTYYVKKNGDTIDGITTRPTQTKYNSELLYIQDEKIAQDHSNNKSIGGLKCPNCGAGVSSLGTKFCEYCGSPVTEINIHSWAFNKFYEV